MPTLYIYIYVPALTEKHVREQAPSHHGTRKERVLGPVEKAEARYTYEGSTTIVVMVVVVVATVVV